MQKRVAITGLGAVTPVGNDVQSTWQALLAGRSGIGQITTFDASTFPVRIAGMVRDFDVEKYVPDQHVRRHLSRAAGFGVAATLEALNDAGIDSNTYEPHEKGVSLGGSVGRADLQELADMSYQIKSTDMHELFRQDPAGVVLRDQNAGAAQMAMVGDCQGPMISVS